MFKLGMNLSILLACVLLMGASPTDSVVTLDSNGSIRVGVMDGNGKAVVGVQVRLFHAKEKKKKAEPTASLIRIRGIVIHRGGPGRAISTGTTGNGGTYLFSNLPPGDYTVVAGVPGGTTAGHASATVTAGQETDVPVTLEPKKIKSGT